MVLVVMTNQSKGKWHITLQGHWGAAATADQEGDLLGDAGGGGGLGVRGGHRHAVQTSLPQGDSKQTECAFSPHLNRSLTSATAATSLLLMTANQTKYFTGWKYLYLSSKKCPLMWCWRCFQPNKDESSPAPAPGPQAQARVGRCWHTVRIFGEWDKI